MQLQISLWRDSPARRSASFHVQFGMVGVCQMIHAVEIIFGLMVVIARLALLARKLNVAYPILFVIGGLVPGLIPGLPSVNLDPKLVFRLFLRRWFTPGFDLDLAELRLTRTGR
jgi:NhaP-type Na+/H+ or K+/H+ antiporter